MDLVRCARYVAGVSALSVVVHADLGAQTPAVARLPFEGAAVAIGDDTSAFLAPLRRSNGVEIMMAGRLVMVREGGRGSRARGYVALDSLGRAKQVVREWPAAAGDAGQAFEALHRVLLSYATTSGGGDVPGRTPMTCQLVPMKVEGVQGVTDRVEFRCQPWIIGLTAVPQPAGKLAYTLDVSLTAP